MELTSFPYVDAKWDDPRRPGENQRWMRIRSHEIEEKVRVPSCNINCFCTVQHFKESVAKKGEFEDHYCGFYFDFDAKAEDYDNSVNNALQATKDDVQRVIGFFRELEIPEALVQVWFSGCKGFHVIVHPEALGIRPSKYLSYMMKFAAVYLQKKLDLRTIDLSVYTRRRMFRLPNSIHQSTGKFKIELYHSELGLSPDKIIELAQHPREQLYPQDEYESVKPDDMAVDWWSGFVKSYSEQEDLKNLSPAKTILKAAEWPDCVKDIMANGLKKAGTRNRATMGLASYFKNVGMPRPECESLLTEWVKKLPSESGEKHRERIANTRAVVNAVYDGKSYNFACAFMLALSSAESKVACCGMSNCETIGNSAENQRPAEIPRVPLSKASEATYIGKKVSVPVTITGKGDAPYDFPRKVTINCRPNLETIECRNCRIAHKGNDPIDIHFDMRDQIILDLINCTNQRRSSAIKRHAGIPTKCYSCTISIAEHGNLEEVRLQPNFISTSFIDSRSENATSIDVIEDGTHCTRIGYYVGHELKVNRKYDIATYVFGHPQNQKIVHVFEEATPSQDDIDKFKMTPKTKKMLTSFCPKGDQTVHEKFDEIHADLESNIHMIWGRTEVAIALDLVYHSVIGFEFQGQYEKKGWMELLILGDSGNGKTKLVERIMKHYQLGEITGVEGGKRTGLIWANYNMGGRLMLVWGKIPQNDRRLLVLDEFSGMPDEEVAMMTRLRTEGIAESQGVNQSETLARTRLIYLSNAKNGKPLSSYNFGIEAVNALFKEHQDVRRLDLAVCVKSGDISLEMINKKHRANLATHYYTTDMCKKLVLWAWSRDPRQVRILPETEERILKASIELGRRYRSDIVLIEASDQRLKIARMACATAARVFSTDETGELLIVRPEHVDFAVEFIKRCYDHKAMEYNVYAAQVQERSYMDEGQKSELKQKWKEFQGYDLLRTIFLGGMYFRKNQLEDLTGYNREEIAKLLSFLSKRFLITSTSGGYRKTPMFTEFLKEFDKIDSTDPPF